MNQTQLAEAEKELENLKGQRSAFIIEVKKLSQDLSNLKDQHKILGSAKRRCEAELREAKKEIERWRESFETKVAHRDEEISSLKKLRPNETIH